MAALEDDGSWMYFSKLSVVRNPPPSPPWCHSRAVAASGCPGGEVQDSIWRKSRKMKEALHEIGNLLKTSHNNFLVGLSLVFPVIIGEQ